MILENVGWGKGDKKNSVCLKMYKYDWRSDSLFICQSVWLVYVKQSSKLSDFICSSKIGVWLSDFQPNIAKIAFGFSNHALAEPIKALYFQQIVLKTIVDKVKSEQLKVLQTKL